MQNASHGGLSTPPEGVTSGENVPPENQEAQIDQAEVEKIVGLLVARGEPYTDMSDDELEERARDILRGNEVDL